MWAFATVVQKDMMMFQALARAAEQCKMIFNPQDLANTAWAFAAVGHKDQAIFEMLAMTAERYMSNFKP